MSDTAEPPVPAPLRYLAVFTVLAALPLVLLGAEVTTKKVGMVDPVGFRAPWDLIAVSWRNDGGAGLRIEYNHRLAGMVVGTCCIALAVGLTLAARGWYRALGWLALFAVGAQGLLGIFRVNLNQNLGPSLALVHGACAQLVIAVLVTVAVLASRTWSLGEGRVPPGLGRGALILSALIYVQIVFGAVTRHLLDPVAQRLHVLLAFVVVGAVFALVAQVRRAGAPVARRWSLLLAGLVCIQPVLGVEAWVRRFGAATVPDAVPSSLGLDLARSGHHVVGTLIFATSVLLTVLLLRPAAGSVAEPEPSREGEARPARQLEGAL